MLVIDPAERPDGRRIDVDDAAQEPRGSRIRVELGIEAPECRAVGGADRSDRDAGYETGHGPIPPDRDRHG
jgi:hypothetical protein